MDTYDAPMKHDLKVYMETMRRMVTLSPEMIGNLQRFFLDPLLKEESDAIDEWTNENYLNDFYFELLMDYREFRRDEYFADLLEKANDNAKIERVFQPLPFDRIFNNAPDLIAVHDIDGFFKQVSANSYKLLGYHPEDLIGKHLLHLVHQEDLHEIFNCFHDFLESNSCAESKFIYQFMLPDNDAHRWVETSFSRIESDQSKTCTGFISITRIIHNEVLVQTDLNSQIWAIDEEIYFLIKDKVLPDDLRQQIYKVTSKLGNMELEILMTPLKRRMRDMKAGKCQY